MPFQKTVLIADDDSTMVHVLALRCGSLGLNVVTAGNGFTAVTKARKNPPDLMIVDVSMPDADGLKVCERLQDLDLVFPIIVLTGRSDDETIRNCESLGAHYVLKETDFWSKLEPRISSLLQTDIGASPSKSEPVKYTSPATRAPKVLTVDDDPGITRAIATRLKYHGVDTLEASDGTQGYMMALREMPDVIISDFSMPNGSADYLLMRLKQAEITRSIPVIILTGITVERSQDTGLRRHTLGRLGASAYLAKPLDHDLLLAELERYITLKPLKQLATV